jgi:hypothetical protein
MQSKPKTTPIIAIVENPVGTIVHALDFRTYNTPKLFQASMLAIWGLSLIWIPTTIGAIQNQRNSIKTIAKDAVPSVILAQRIVDAMSDMDTMVASELLGEVPKSQDKTQEPEPLLLQVGSWEKQSKDMAKDTPPLTKRRNDLAERLTLAAANSTFAGEDQAIRQLILYSGDYFAYADRAQAAHRKGDRAEALKQYKLAAQVLDEKFIPSANQLREINISELGNAYNDSRNQGANATMAVLLLGSLTIAAMVGLQLLLYIRTRRSLNPLLLAATIGALVFLLHAVSILVSTGAELRVLKEDSYGSLLALRLARALLYGANSDESRYLLDQPNQATHEAAFRKKTNLVYARSDDQTVLANAIENLRSPSRVMPNSGQFSYFAKAINNITFAPERPPMIKMMEEYKEYMAIDQQIRDLVNQKRRSEAIRLCLGISNDKFNAMKKAMDEVKIVNEKVFEDVEQKAMGELNGFEIKATIALGAMATLVFFGLRPRIREYD